MKAHSRKIHFLTLFPDSLKTFLDTSILKRAAEKEVVAYFVHNLRDWALDSYGTVDDRPFGGGVGMLLRPEPIFSAFDAIIKKKTKKTLVILMTPQGEILTEKKAQELADENKDLFIICPHYEGVDERVRQHLVDLEISIGDYVLTGGELPALVLTDSIVRLLPGVLDKEMATLEESFSIKDERGHKLLEHPQYTRPAMFRGFEVPEVLISGNHAMIQKWKIEQALKRTKERRPDLLETNHKSQ